MNIIKIILAVFNFLFAGIAINQTIKSENKNFFGGLFIATVFMFSAIILFFC